MIFLNALRRADKPLCRAYTLYSSASWGVIAQDSAEAIDCERITEFTQGVSVRHNVLSPATRENGVNCSGPQSAHPHHLYHRALTSRVRPPFEFSHEVENKPALLRHYFATRGKSG